MPRYLKKYNSESLKEPSMVTDQEGEGAILNLAVKALSHLIPGLLAKFGEKAGEHVGDEVGKIVRERIGKMRTNKKEETNIQTMEGGKIKNKMKEKEPDYNLYLNRPNSKKNINPISSYEVNPEILATPPPSKTKKGNGINVAGIPRPQIMRTPNCKPCEEKEGKGFEVAGKKGRGKGKGTKVAGGAFEVAGVKGKGYIKPRGRPKKQKGMGVVQMKGSGVDVINMPMDIKPFDKVDKLKELLKSNNKKEPKTEKCKIMKTHASALKYIMDNIGAGETVTDQLNKLGKKLFKTKFGGAIASDQLPKKINKKYYIVNTDPSDKPGQHWMGVTEKYIYDSFGRSAEELKEFIFDRKLINKNNNRDQSYNETNCGQRSLAFLVCHFIHGDDVAKYI